MVGFYGFHIFTFSFPSLSLSLSLSLSHTHTHTPFYLYTVPVVQCSELISRYDDDIIDVFTSGERDIETQLCSCLTGELPPLLAMTTPTMCKYPLYM